MLACLWLATLSVAPAWGQVVAPEAFRFEHLTVDQGLSHSDGMAVAQDQSGFIWIGTNRGIDRYDGYSLKKYVLRVSERTGLSGNRVRTLHAAPTGQLWAGTERAGLSLYNTRADRFLSFDEVPVPAAFRLPARLLSLATVVALDSDKQGRLWVGTSQSGVFVLSFGPQGAVQTIRQVPRAPGLAQQYQVSSLAADPEGKIWLGTFNAGLRVIRPEQADLAAQSTGLREAVRVLHLDHRGDLWIGLDQQVAWVSAANRRTGRALGLQRQGPVYPQLQSLLLDSFGRLWVGTIYGLYLWQPGVLSAEAPPLSSAQPTLLLPEDGNPSSINSERIHQIFEDRNHIVWLCASSGGINKVDLRQKPFGWLRQRRGGQNALANNYINAIYKEDATNTLWFGTRNGVSAYHLGTKTYRNYLNQTRGKVSAGVDVATIVQTRTGALWFGTRTAGLTRLTRQNGREVLTTYNPRLGTGSLAAAGVESLAEDQYGTLWVATFTGGLARLSLTGELLGTYHTGNSRLPTNQFTYLLFDRSRQVLWASTRDAGLLKLRVTPDAMQVVRQYQHQAGQTNSLRVNYVWPLLLDEQHNLWIGTIGGGLHQLASTGGREIIRRYARWLPESDVESILADDEGHLWIGGTGLYRFTPATRQYLRYDVADGLQSNAFKIGSAARSQDGTLYFGGINGISYFQPHDIRPNPSPPIVQLTGLRIANQPVAVGQELNGRVVVPQPLTTPQTVTIKASENDFSVEFVALNYTNPQKNQYAYQLVGYNKGWVSPPPGQRTASFANLPPGRYTLRVKATNGEGVWSRQEATVAFDVRAAWWKTGWAYALYALLALGAVAVYRRTELAQQQLKGRLALERFQKDKEKELTDLKLGFFTNVSHELRTPLTLILGPMEEIMSSPGPVTGLRDKMQLMHRQTRKLLDLVNQLLDFRKVESGNIPLRTTYTDAVRFLTDLYSVFQLKAQEREVEYVLDVPAEPILLYVDRSKLEIILTNLLANAFKYTRTKGRVELSATIIGNPGGEAVYQNQQLTGNYLKINVSDTGVGIKPQELPRIFDPYYQASHTDTLRMTGTGIGLSLARQFAERHGGYLGVASTEGVGTTFELRLPFGRQHLEPADIQPAEHDLAVPLTPEPDELGALPEEVLEAPLTFPRAPRLLIVEDNDDVRTYLYKLFEPEYEVLMAEDGMVGWQVALAQLPDVVVSDVMMPHSDGLELCQRIKQHPKTAHIPVLLLTARTAETQELEGLGTGADDYVSKPFSPAILQAKTASLLRNRLRLQEYYQRQILLQPTEIVVADADREFLEKAMAVVEEHLNDPEFSVQMLVREVGMSQSVFYRRVKSITGQTAVEFIRDVRMKRAAQLLAQTPMRVSEVAYHVGIEDPKYFRKTFQKIYSLSPSEYAKQHRAAPETPAAARA